LPSGNATVVIDGLGQFAFDTGRVETVRPDIFRTGHYSLFDVLVQLDKQGDISLEYHFDEALDTHIIDSINGKSNWWYEAKYSGGWFERSAFRMDMYLYKNGTKMRMEQRNGDFFAKLYQSFADEVTRLVKNGGEVIIPTITLGHKKYEDVRVTPYNVRSDVLQPDVITALDVVLSLGEQGEVKKLKVTWYENIGSANPVDNYFIELIDQGDGLVDDEAITIINNTAIIFFILTSYVGISVRLNIKYIELYPIWWNVNRYKCPVWPRK
jgi:hypothetical protein